MILLQGGILKNQGTTHHAVCFWLSMSFQSLYLCYRLVRDLKLFFFSQIAIIVAHRILQGRKIVTDITPMLRTVLKEHCVALHVWYLVAITVACQAN